MATGKKKAVNLFVTPDDSGEELSLEGRRTDELVIGFVGPVGSGVSLTAKMVMESLTEDYGYEVSSIKVSDIIRESAGVVGEECPNDLPGDERISQLQKIGSKLRDQMNDEYLAEKCVEKIGLARVDSGYAKSGETLISEPRRYVHIIDSLKHPAEVELLQDVYGETFWLFGVFAPENVRKARLDNGGVDSGKIEGIFKVDEDEGFSYGQKVRDTIFQSDFFVRNDGENDEGLKKAINRFLEIIFNISVQTPTQDEAAMYVAVSTASTSGCLSRQVGAAIYSKAGELIGKGANDVPKYGGGLYSSEDEINDHRCYKWGGKICHNDDRKNRLYDKIITELIEGGHVKNTIKRDKIVNSLRKTDVRSLIEYSRAVHAEMEAIISVARGAKNGLVGSTMYSTTFPCHSCARHIVASGIDQVIYIEPYPKSLADKLHHDSISDKDDGESKHVIFLQYEGVAPKNVIKLFQQKEERKAEGKAITRKKKEASPISRSPLDGFSTREQIVIQRIKAQEERVTEENRGK